MGKPVTDPALLALLEEGSTPTPVNKAVTDPALLAQLNGEAPSKPEPTWGQALKNVAGAGVDLVRGGAASLAGDVAGLASMAANMYVPLDRGSPLIDPESTRDAVSASVNSIGGEVGDPESPAKKILPFVAQTVNKAGDKLVDLTGTGDDPLVGNMVHAVPMGALALAGARTPKTPLKPGVKPSIVPKNATPEQLHAEAASTLLDEGVSLATEQRGTGVGAKQSGSLGRVADTFFGKSSLARKQLGEFTSAVLRKVGINVKNATPDAMADVRRHVTQTYNEAHAGNHINVDKALADDLTDISTRAQRNPAVERKFEAMLEHIRQQSEATPNGPRISAKRAEEIRSELGGIEGSTDPNIRNVAREVKDALDAATDRSVTPEVAAKLKEARTKYHFMRQIEDAIDSKGGFISPRKLLNAIERKRNKNEAVYGKGDQSLVTLARAGAKILPGTVGDSGTATRSADFVKGAALLSHPLTAAKGAAALLGGRLLNEASASRGTPAALAKDAAARAKGSSPTRTAVQTAVTKENPEDKKRRLSAEALRSN